MRLLLLVPLLLLAACGAEPADSPVDSLGGPAPAADELSVDYDEGDGGVRATWTLTCAATAAGTHPDAAAACAHLATLDAPFTPLPEDAICTEQYGGPQTARVTGQWGGEPVELELSRSNGCRISQWDGLVPLVPAAA